MSGAKGVEAKVETATARHLFVSNVEPFWSNVERRAKDLGFFGAWKERRRMKRLVAEISRQLALQEVRAGAWDQTKGETVCSFKIDRQGVLHDLREFAAKLEDKSYVSIVEGNQKSSFPHLMQSKERFAFYIPVEFPDPLWVSLDPNTDPIPVGSSVKLESELDSLNEHLRVEETFKLKKMVDFFAASDKEIAKFESTADMQGGHFWVKFGYVLIRKLAHKSVEHSLPIVFGTQG